METKDNKVAGGISRDVIIDGEIKGNIYLRDKEYSGQDEFIKEWEISHKYQVSTADKPYKARYFKTYNGAVNFIVKNGEKFMSLQKAVNKLYA